MQKSFKLCALSTLTVAVLAACGGGNDAPAPAPVVVTPPVTVPAAPPAPSIPVATGDVAALTAAGNIITFFRATPGTLVSNLAITGLASGEQLIGIDVRPATGELYTVSTLGRIYTLEPGTGVVTFKAALASDPVSPTPFTALAGTVFGIDFNPVPDRLRIVSNTGQNLRINVDTGATLVDGAINGAAAAITSAAYTNSFAGTTTTQLFDLDCTSGQRYLQSPPNNGTLTNPTPLGVTCTAATGFDIDPRNNTGYAALVVGGVTSLYTVSLATGGGATAVGQIAGGQALRGLALINPAPKPTVYILTAGAVIARIDPAAPNTLVGSVNVSGLTGGETLLGIDFRPANSVLYGLTSAARLLSINPDTGFATFVASLIADVTDVTAPNTGLRGNLFSVDFNPVADRLRVISDAGQSLRINVVTGATTTDTDINRTPAATVVGAAYANSFAGTTATALFDLDAASDVLALQSPPNDGALVNVGALGLDLVGQNAMDIAGGDNGLVLGAFRIGGMGPYSLYNVNLTSGAATLRGTAAAAQIGGASGPVVTDIAIKY